MSCRVLLALLTPLALVACDPTPVPLDPPDARTDDRPDAGNPDAPPDGKQCDGEPADETDPASGCATASCAACPLPAHAEATTCSAAGDCDWVCPAGLIRTASGCGPAARQVVAGSRFTCALTLDRAVRCWGAGDGGDGPAFAASLVPVTVPGLTDVSTLAAGTNHACALTTSGGVRCWGRNAEGQLGDGTKTTSQVPVDVVGLGAGVIAIAAGTRHSCAVLATGAVRCWGDNALLQLGRATPVESSTPVEVSGSNPGAIAIGAAGFHTCIVTAGGRVVCWGNNDHGQLGNQATARSSLPVEAFGITDAIAVTAGGLSVDGYTCAVRSGGSVACWGRNFWGQLGVGANNADHTTPTSVVGLTGVSELAAGEDHTCAVVGSSLRCWGHGSYGKLASTGYNSPNGYHWLPTPTTITEFGAPVHVAAGGQHTCVVTPTNITCSGIGSSGQLGNNLTQTGQLVPTPVVGW